MRYLILSLTATMVCALSAPAGAAEEISDYDRFRLWNGCSPMELVVEPLSDDAKDIGLSEERIETIVRSRLRAARIYATGDPSASSSYLYVNMNVAGDAFNVSLRYNKWVTDSQSDLSARAVTWQLGATGTLGESSDYILSGGVSELTDRFIDEFLRVNAAACRNSR